MLVYRIAQLKYTEQLYASGKEARWNFNGEKVIYTSSSRSLACLENVVHSSGELLQKKYGVMIIYLPDEVSIEKVNQTDLSQYWNRRARPMECQKKGSKWLKEGKTLILQVPSAIINQETNFIINVNHSEFAKVKIIDVETFPFDQRIK